MTRHQTALFVAEHKWDYRSAYCFVSCVISTPLMFIRQSSSFCPSAFGFAAALLETIPFIGLLFSVSNRIGAAMWAHGQYYQSVFGHDSIG